MGGVGNLVRGQVLLEQATSLSDTPLLQVQMPYRIHTGSIPPAFGFRVTGTCAAARKLYPPPPLT